MKRLSFKKRHNLDQLQDEIFARVPELAPIRTHDDLPKEPVMIPVEGDGENIWITVPDKTDPDVIQPVIDAHKPK